MSKTVKISLLAVLAVLILLLILEYTNVSIGPQQPQTIEVKDVSTGNN